MHVIDFMNIKPLMPGIVDRYCATTERERERERKGRDYGQFEYDVLSDFQYNDACAC